jgi:hypothetical protein
MIQNDTICGSIAAKNQGRMVMTEGLVNYRMGNRDFARYLRELKDRQQIIIQAAQWFDVSGTPIVDGLDVVTAAFSNAQEALNLPAPAPLKEMTYQADQKRFAVYVRDLKDPRQQVAVGLAWFEQNKQRFGDATHLTTVVFNALSSLVRQER